MFATSFTVDGINYTTLTNSTVMVESGTYIRSITIPSTVTYNNIIYSVTRIGIFQSCKGLTSITIPSSVTAIGDWTFYNCTSLTNISIPSTLTWIGGWSFYNCTSLTNFAIPSSVTWIGDYAFEDCRGLTNVSIPFSVTHIGMGAFLSCTGLTNITIPSSVKYIGQDAFNGCTGLKSIYTYATVPVSLDRSNYVFNLVNKTTCTLYVPNGSKTLYQATNQWKDFVNIVEFEALAVNIPVNTTIKITFNSTTKTIQMHGTNAPAQILVYNLNGVLVKSEFVSTGESLQVQSLPKGIFVVKVLVNYEVLSEKIVI